MNLLYLIGPPGAGKTTIVEALTAKLLPVAVRTPLAHLVWLAEAGDVIELGGRREGFAGTDVLPLNAQPQALAFLRSERPSLVLAEGDRLANGLFFSACQTLGYAVQVALVEVPPALAAARRAERAERLGTGLQNESWVKGRITKSAQLAKAWRALPVDGRGSPLAAAEALAARDPVARALLSG